MVWWWGERAFSSIKGLVAAGGGSEGWIGYIGGGDRWHVVVAVGVTAMAGLALAATIVMSSRRGSLKSPWSSRKRKHLLSPEQWKRFFTPDGRLFDGGIRLLKKVRSGGVDQNIRSEVWPFLLGVYELNSSEAERKTVRKLKRKEYKKIRKICQCLLKLCYEGDKLLKEIHEAECEHGSQAPANKFDIIHDETSTSNTENPLSGPSDDQSDITYAEELDDEREITQSSRAHSSAEENIKPETTEAGFDAVETESSSDSSEETETVSMTSFKDIIEANDRASKSSPTVEDFTTWQRIIRLDAVRANPEWVIYAPAQASVSDEKARELADSVGLKDYDHLEPFMIHHAARLVAVLEAYAIYDPTIGYCQGMSDLLSPILSVMGQDDEAFWCFVGFMKKARHNFRLDEVGIRRQLSIVSKIIKFKDPHLYKHLEKLQAEDCFFVYRMVVVLFRRELNFEQTLCLWEVMWADQTAIRAGFGKSAWGRIRLRAPPTDDLLLYAIAACVLQRRKLIIERYSSMDEILRECNNMAGNLDVWKLLDDAHDLVVTLHEKIT